jgi:hypothetical protein
VCCTGSLPPFFLLNIIKHRSVFSRKKNLTIEGAKEKFFFLQIFKSPQQFFRISMVSSNSKLLLKKLHTAKSE